jgi:hypothetical protein
MPTAPTRRGCGGGSDGAFEHARNGVPALGRDYIYLSSSQGHLLSVRQKDGEVRFAYSFRKPMIFQPALVDRNVYVGNGDGLLIYLKTNGKDTDGWYEWGGNPQHNK